MPDILSANTLKIIMQCRIDITIVFKLSKKAVDVSAKKDYPPRFNFLVNPEFITGVKADVTILIRW